VSTLVIPPWYRHLWPWLLMLGPAVAVLGGATTLWLAVVSDDGLVADDYYKQGLAVNRVLSREQRAKALGYRARVSFLDGIRVRLTATENLASTGRLKLLLVHPTQKASDASWFLNLDARGDYVAATRPANAASWRGRRTLILEDEAQTWRLVGDMDTGRTQEVELTATK
jgi:uncharacterized protein